MSRTHIDSDSIGARVMPSRPSSRANTPACAGPAPPKAKRTNSRGSNPFSMVTSLIRSDLELGDGRDTRRALVESHPQPVGERLDRLRGLCAVDSAEIAGHWSRSQHAPSRRRAAIVRSPHFPAPIGSAPSFPRWGPRPWTAGLRRSSGRGGYILLTTGSQQRRMAQGPRAITALGRALSPPGVRIAGGAGTITASAPLSNGRASPRRPEGDRV